LISSNPTEEIMAARTTAVLVMLAAFASRGALAGDTSGIACSLLIPGEIDAATGAKAGAGTPTETNVPTGQGKQEAMYTCWWPIAAQKAQVVVSMSRLPPGQSVQAIAKQNPGMDALRAKHYLEESRDFGDRTCSAMTPPASAKGGMNMIACTAAARGKLVSVVFMSPTKKLSIDQTKTLLDTAVSRVR
jgi:hypothetical protein